MVIKFVKIIEECCPEAITIWEMEQRVRLKKINTIVKKIMAEK